MKRSINKWHLQYLELVRHRKNPNYGRTKCSRCLLSTGREEAAIYFRYQSNIDRVWYNWQYF
ncbi:MAG TPA: hypothetical protein VKA09_12885, partial [Nitrososphaeraceae archaeon]|nr:hypothetical protein [Nitrososphaeraceae archaeon]